MKSRTTHDRDEFERLVRKARMERTVYLSEAIAGVAHALWKRVAGAIQPRAEKRRLAPR